MADAYRDALDARLERTKDATDVGEVVAALKDSIVRGRSDVAGSALTALYSFFPATLEPGALLESRCNVLVAADGVTAIVEASKAFASDDPTVSAACGAMLVHLARCALPVHGAKEAVAQAARFSLMTLPAEGGDPSLQARSRDGFAVLLASASANDVTFRTEAVAGGAIERLLGNRAPGDVLSTSVLQVLTDLCNADASCIDHIAALIGLDAVLATMAMPRSDKLVDGLNLLGSMLACPVMSPATAQKFMAREATIFKVLLTTLSGPARGCAELVSGVCVALATLAQPPWRQTAERRSCEPRLAAAAVDGIVAALRVEGVITKQPTPELPVSPVMVAACAMLHFVGGCDSADANAPGSYLLRAGALPLLENALTHVDAITEAVAQATSSSGQRAGKAFDAKGIRLDLKRCIDQLQDLVSRADAAAAELIAEEEASEAKAGKASRKNRGTGRSKAAKAAKAAEEQAAAAAQAVDAAPTVDAAPAPPPPHAPAALPAEAPAPAVAAPSVAAAPPPAAPAAIPAGAGPPPFLVGSLVHDGVSYPLVAGPPPGWPWHITTLWGADPPPPPHAAAASPFGAPLPFAFGSFPAPPPPHAPFVGHEAWPVQPLSPHALPMPMPLQEAPPGLAMVPPGGICGPGGPLPPLAFYPPGMPSPMSINAAAAMNYNAMMQMAAAQQAGGQAGFAQMGPHGVPTGMQGVPGMQGMSHAAQMAAAAAGMGGVGLFVPDGPGLPFLAAPPPQSPPPSWPPYLIPPVAQEHPVALRMGPHPLAMPVSPQVAASMAAVQLGAIPAMPGWHGAPNPSAPMYVMAQGYAAAPQWMPVEGVMGASMSTTATAVLGTSMPTASPPEQLASPVPIAPPELPPWLLDAMQRLQPPSAAASQPPPSVLPPANAGGTAPRQLDTSDGSCAICLDAPAVLRTRCCAKQGPVFCEPCAALLAGVTRCALCGVDAADVSGAGTAAR
jgi:hypothetical protein